jgi:protein-L-isoaspartate(D-aspartate) O-methyltransferase
MLNRQTQDMIDDIEREVRLTSKMIGRKMLDPKVMSVMAATPRDKFIPKSQLEYAYNNGPLSIGYGQTISQPYIVALMTDLLELETGDTVLEIGTGSGYQAAVLSQLCKQVYTIEYVPELAELAKARLQNLGYKNIETKTGNGYDGWPEHAPYDGVIVTAAATHIPEPLLEQLKPGGRMVIPIGERYFYQELMLVEKDEDGKINRKDILSVAFVPFQGER